MAKISPKYLTAYRRLCILGEHSDWASGYKSCNPAIHDGAALVLGINKGIYLRARKHHKLRYRCNLEELKISMQCQADLEQLCAAIDNAGLEKYVLATLKLIKEHYDIDGIDIECYKMDLPIQKGLASSAAICMAVIRACNLVYDMALSLNEEMELAYLAERSIGSLCGQMDQVCAYGNKLLYLRFVQNKVEVEMLNCRESFDILVVDLNNKKDTKRILSDLHRRFPYPKTDQDQMLHDTLGKNNQTFVENAIRAIENGDIKLLGQIMNEAQESFDKYVAVASPEELEAPRMHNILKDRHIEKCVYGAKGVGSQGDGSVQLLLKNKRDSDKLRDYIITTYGYKSFLFSVT